MKVQPVTSVRKPRKYSERETRSLLKACRVGDLRQVVRLLSEGVDPDAHDGTTGTRPLHSASHYGHIPIARVLLKAGADINAREGFDGKDRPLETASKAGLIRMVKFLTANRAEINIGGVCPALTEAAINNHPMVVEFLIEHGAKPESNLLSRAMWSCSVSLIERLINSGLKVFGNGKKEDKAIVSGAARQANGSAITELIAKHKADLFSPINDDSDTPLHKAQHEQTALFLINAGANIQAVNRFGETPLHACAKRGFALACKRLVELGANPSAKTKRGFTPRMIAKLCGQQKAFDVLSQAFHYRKPKDP